MDLGRKEENLSNQDQVFREIGVCKIPKRSCSYENIHCLVKLEAHGIELKCFYLWPYASEFINVPQWTCKK